MNVNWGEVWCGVKAGVKPIGVIVAFSLVYWNNL